MKVGESVDIPTSRCINCGTEIEMTFVIGHETSHPHPGDVSICAGCGHIMVFADGLTLREPTAAEAHKIAGDPRLLAAQAGCAVYRANKNQEKG
jgi:2-keto-4-pentenoate hydratase